MRSAYLPSSGGFGGLSSTAASSGITSTCGTGVSAAYQETVNCRFSEKGYSGIFNVTDDALTKAGLASIAPQSGTSATSFSITGGKKTGFGTFTVTDAKGHSLSMQWGQLPSAAHSVCVRPRTSKQDVAVPPTGGLIVSVAIAAFAKGASGCDGIEVATGAEAQKVLGEHALRSIAPRATARVNPLFTITFGEAFGSNPLTGGTTVVSGMQMKTSPDLVFPDGIYLGKIDKGANGWIPGQDVIEFEVKGGVFRVFTPTDKNGKSFPIVVPGNSDYIVAVYPAGVTSIPTTPKPSSSPKPTPSGKKTPIPTSSPYPGAWGKPPPAEGAVIGTWGYDWPQPPCTGVPYECDEENQAIVGIEFPWVPGGFSGTAYVEEDLGYMDLKWHSIVCPKQWDVTADDNGDVQFSIPAKHPYGSINQTCSVTWSTIPKGKSGIGYEWTVTL